MFSNFQFSFDTPHARIKLKYYCIFILSFFCSGEATAYALSAIEPRGKLFITPGTKVYPGMIIGEHSREHDLEVNPVKCKALTNMRAAGKEDSIRLTPIKPLTLEEMISYIQGI